jgi:hypothetical protein
VNLRQVVRKRPCQPKKEQDLEMKNVFDGTWTLAHGFLSVMGALVIETEDGREYSVLEEDEPLKLFTSGQATFPQIRPKDIRDRSKADSFAKLFALLQSGWLLINILARAGYHLYVSPLELMTVAYIICAFTMYGFWWHKPKDVAVPMIIKVPLPPADRMASKKPSEPALEEHICKVALRRSNFGNSIFRDNKLVGDLFEAGLDSYHLRQYSRSSHILWHPHRGMELSLPYARRADCLAGLFGGLDCCSRWIITSRVV